MEGIKGGGGGGDGGGRVGVGEDMGDEMQCSDHPYRNKPGGICAFCLREKLGKLVSSSFPSPRLRGSSSSSSSPSFRSDIGSSSSTAGGTTGTTRDQEAKRTMIQFLLAKEKKKVSISSQSDRDIVFKRSKSAATPIRNPNYFVDTDDKRTGFWSFLYKSNIATRKTEKITSFNATTPIGSALKPRERRLEEEEEEEFSPNSKATATASASASSFGRRVSRSRSVGGCGSSRSFSGGDLFESISTGFGDFTLRRVESQREAKPKVSPTGLMNERVKCGGLFRRFVMTSSSFSLSYWVSPSSSAHVNVNGRSRSWVWAFTSPMRAFTTNKRHRIIREVSRKNTTPDLNAIPSLLSVRS